MKPLFDSDWIFRLLIFFLAFLTTSCGGGSGGGSSSSHAISTGTQSSGSAKYYISVTLKFPDDNKENKKIFFSRTGEKEFEAKLPRDLVYYEVSLYKAGTNVLIQDPIKVEMPSGANKATVTFWDVPEGMTELKIKGYNGEKVLVAEASNVIDVSLASITANGSNGQNSGGGSFSGVNSEPIVIPTEAPLNGPSDPKITGIEPKSPKIGDLCTITGSGFTNNTGDGKYIYFAGVKATEYVLWTDTKIICRVPQSAATCSLTIYVCVGGGVISTSSPSTVVTVQPSGGNGGGGGGGQSGPAWYIGLRPSQPWYFATPTGLASDSAGNIYVVASNTHCIQKFDSAGNFILKWGKNGGDGTSGTGNGEFNRPYGVAVDSSGNVYVAEYSNHRIQKFTSSGAYITKWGRNGGDGTSGQGNGEFNYPVGISVDTSGNVYVADTSNNRIQKFNSTGTYITKWGRNGGDGTSGAGNGEFYNPYGITTDSSGNIYVSDYNNHRVQKFNSSGTYMTKWGRNGGDGTSGTGNGEFYSPYGIATDSSGNVYVAENNNHRVQKFNSSGTYITKWGRNGGDGTYGAGNGEFSYPYNTVIDSSGNLLVSDNTNRIQIFNSSGTYLNKWGASGTGSGEFALPMALCFEQNGNILVSDYYNHRIQRFNLSGTFLSRWGKNGGDGSFGTGNGELNLPRGVSCDSSGNIYVSEIGSHRIQKFSSTGAYLTKWGRNGGDGTSGTGNGEFNAPYAVTADSSGNIYVTDSSNHRIQKFNSSGVYVTKWGRNGGDGTSGQGNGEFLIPIGVSVDSLGNVYVSDTYNHRVQKFNSSGAYITKWGKNGGDGTLGSGNGEFYFPQGIYVDSSGNVYVADTYNHRIQKFDSNGTYIKKWGRSSGNGSSGYGYGEFCFPTGVIVDSSGSLYVCDVHNNRVQIGLPQNN